MSISAASATAMTNALGNMETHIAALAQDVTTVDEAFSTEFRVAALRPGHDELTLELQMGPALRDRLLVQRLRGLGLVGLLVAATTTGASDETWAADLISRIQAAAAKAAA